MNEEILIVRDNILYNIAETFLIKDYINNKYIPELDKLLDWRLFLMNSETKSELEELLVKREIIAVDYLLNLKYKQ